MHNPAPRERRMRVHELLASPSSWTQHCTARDWNGEGTMSQFQDATKWCLMGALIKCYAGAECAHTLALQFACQKITSRIKQGIMGWNDHPDRTHKEVLALCEELDV